jgi:hypothetical protein
MSHSGGGGGCTVIHYTVNAPQAEAEAIYAARRDAIQSSHSDEAGAGGRGRRTEKLLATLILLLIVAESAWYTVVLAQRFPAVVGGPVAAVILVAFLVAYRLISAARPR